MSNLLIYDAWNADRDRIKELEQQLAIEKENVDRLMAGNKYIVEATAKRLAEMRAELAAKDALIARSRFAICRVIAMCKVWGGEAVRAAAMLEAIDKAMQ